MDMIEGFAESLRSDGKAEATVGSYVRAVGEYARWYQDSFGAEVEKLLASNVSDYVSYLRTVKELRGTSLNPKVAALKSFNHYLVEAGVQDDVVVNKRHRDKVQSVGVSPSIVDQAEVDAFRQAILLGNGPRDHAIITIMAYASPRISETLGIKLADVDLVGREVLVRGKGNKVRILIIGSKVVNAISEYLKVRKSDSPYLFVSRQSDTLNRSVVNRICNKYSDVITPHVLRHFFCAHALKSGYMVNEVAHQAGHSNLKTTMTYLDASRKEMQDKADKL